MLCDYFLIRKTKIDTDELYNATGSFKGIHWRAMIVLVIAILPNLPGFINAATNTVGTDGAIFPDIFDSIYNYAWFVGVFVSVALYWVLMQFTSSSND